MTAAASPDAPPFPWTRRTTGAAFALATVLGIVNAAQTLTLQSMERQRAPTWTILAFGIVGWWCWAAAAPAVFALSRRWPLRPRWWVSLPLHVGAAALLSTLCAAVLALLLQVVPLDAGQARPLGPTLLGLAVSRLQGNLLIYASIAAIAWALQLRHQVQAQALRAASLEGALAQAELMALRMQLDPHFLFNTLHAIRTLIDDDPAGARQMLVRLGDLLRATLGEGRAQEVPLRDELAFLRGYLEIEATRFADRLQVVIDVPETLLDAQVPSFALQPLAENAIRHGIAQRIDGGQIRVTARAASDGLVLEMRNTAASAESPTAEGHGIGFATTRARLQRLYGAEASLTLTRDGADTLVALQLPRRRGAA